MKILGEPLFAKDADGRLASRVGTLFFKTPGLVTRRGIHAMQRMMWIDEVNAGRAAKGLPPMTEAEEEEELAESVDLIFTEDCVLIRPDPNHMDLAMRADEELQKLVSKRKIRFLNTHAAKVRNALRARGENWRMARQPISQDDMARLIENSRVAISGEPFYYYNSATGTRYVTVAGSEGLAHLPAGACREQMKEAQKMLTRRNRLGHVELDLFPTTTPPEIKQNFKSLDIDSLSDEELTATIERLDAEWRMSIPPELREESVDNFDWRNAMCATISAGPNETSADERDLIQGISPEFYRQIEWLPGARIADGELIFDPLWDEWIRTRDPELAELCDPRARNILFNFMRQFGDFEYLNVGRIVNSLARSPIAGSRRGSVYIFQYKVAQISEPQISILRFQKWGTAEHLDEGKDLLAATLEANEYTDYIMDRRLMCQQLGMTLPPYLGIGQFTEPYLGKNQYRGTTIRTSFFMRAYVPGTASDKIPTVRYRNPAFALKFAKLMGEAAAMDLIVGRRSTETKENLFDRNYEVVQLGADGLPARIVITDHAGTFVNYLHELEDSVAPYANVVRRRVKWLSDPGAFASAYVESFAAKLSSVQTRYRARRRAFDELFVHRPFDVAGSGAYRWAKTLERLDRCDTEQVAARLMEAIGA
ncbi:MAG: hypothetical protein K6F50_06745 [Kiritimatiellae bacterium]|nr:hypothetical protein [Kiritimatiellia bacterium]